MMGYRFALCRTEPKYFVMLSLYTFVMLSLYTFVMLSLSKQTLF